MPRTLLALVVALLSLNSPVSSQTLKRNPQMGDYVLTYKDNYDTLRTVVITAIDRVDASLTVEVSVRGGAFVYDYVLTNGSTARQNIGFLDLLCPAGDPQLAASAPPSWNARASASGQLDRASDSWLCSYSYRNQGAWVAPGSRVDSLRITSNWLPAVRPARAFGLAAPISLPTLVEDTPDTVYRLVARAQGFGFFTGGGFAFWAVVPARPRAALAEPGPGLDSVVADLAQVCSLAWIADGSACTSLGVLVSQAREGVAQGNTAVARAVLATFLSALDAQHGLGLAVSDNAFWLLQINAEFILSRLGRSTR